MLVNPVRFPPGRARLSTSPAVNRIRHANKNDGDRSGSVLGCYNSIRRDPDKYVNLETDQFSREAGKPIEVTLRMPVLNGNVLPFDMAEFA